ncbi:large ribosomal subunit protein uL16m-like [Musca domestica]|uniref:Large ribosomal subunit protein uL16m n=1 Tax=Musca domestica TaxID=7370 RepID=A0A1I8MG53_MUSDO|nr:large ribosomal subunit protein uL16m [Musca domestica]XP_058983200.1 large ribosomal subunit protein uL16m-like [Musca domestica]
MLRNSKLLLQNVKALINQRSSAGLKYFAPPVKYTDFKQVERPKLRIMERVPQYPPNLRPPKMQKKLRFMRGPEVLHNNLLHKQYGIIASGGGRLRWGHFEMMRLTIGRKMDTNRMFAIWRVPAPWQPVTKKGQGQRMGGGKGAIDHYVTPVKSGRVILEISGKCEFAEVKPFLDLVANILPFKAEVVSQEILDQRAHTNELLQKENQNPFSMKYVMQNNLSGCHRWLSPVDHKWFGKYV